MKGDKSQPCNPSRWKSVCLYLPGHKIFTPALPWVSKVCSDGTTIASDVVTYMDDAQPVGSSDKECCFTG
eukprot:14651888-Ditylum_brightwellii.AAC.1